ncbi:uncharacterized protein LOC100211234 [Hydra vulgaris]|uniref:uncharacterized protein LOC100211234 n=1 Tax=Hydra vulgaris TaxID=6087 RepID=UPI000192701A|nr:uncharacterized protein LOC100211234 [Hydra vulgaris]
MGLRLQLVSFFNANLGAIFLLVAVFTNHWAGRENANIHTYENLSTKCSIHKHDNKARVACKLIETTFGHWKGEFLPVKIFLYASLVVHLISIFVSIYVICKNDINKTEKWLAVMQTAILILALVGLSIYATQYDSNYYSLKWSYAFAWGGIMCMFAALVVTIINIDIKRK